MTSEALKLAMNPIEVDPSLSPQMQITQILAKSRRQELLNALNNALKDYELIIKTRIKMKELKSQRGSTYRGVSRNGQKWQVQLLGNLKKHYIGSICKETKAARIYDAYAILAHGLKAKTNFSYSKGQLLKILERENDAEMIEAGDVEEWLMGDEKKVEKQPIEQELILPKG